MNCRDIKQLWQSLPLDRDFQSESAHAGSAGGEPTGEDQIAPALGTISAHLDHCEVCREEYAAERHWNELLTRRMLDVPVPAGLVDRIKTRLSESTKLEDAVIQPASFLEGRRGSGLDSASQDATISRRRLLRWGSLAATGLAAVGSAFWWMGNPWNPGGIVLTDLAEEITGDKIDWNSLPEYQGSLPPLPSRKEMSIPEQVRELKPRGLVKNGEQFAAVYRFPAAPVPGQPAAEVVLVVLDLHLTRISSAPPAKTFGGSEFLYFHDRAVKIWGSSSTVFCCFATAAGTVYLEALSPRESIA